MSSYWDDVWQSLDFDSRSQFFGSIAERKQFFPRQTNLDGWQVPAKERIRNEFLSL